MTARLPSKSSVGGLPGVLAEIARIAGREMAIKIALSHGGNEIYIPRNGRLEGHPLTALVGQRGADALAARFGGATVYIPFARRPLAAHLAGQGLSTAEIAARLGISKRIARAYRASAR